MDVLSTTWVDGNVFKSGDLNRICSDVNAANAHNDFLSAAQSNIPRWAAQGTVAPTTGELVLSYFVADSNVAIHNVTTLTVAGYGPTPSLCKMGIYSVSGSGDLTLGQATANNTELFFSPGTAYTQALSGVYSLTQGSVYAVAVLVTSLSTMPSFAGAVLPASECAVSPPLSGVVAGQVDLSNAIAANMVSPLGGVVYTRVS